MWYALSVGALLINALGLDLARRLGDPWRSRDRAGFAAILGAALQRAAGLGALAVAVAALIGERVIWVVVGVAGDEARVAFTVLAVGAACAYVACLYDYALLVTGKGRLQAGGIACDLAVTTVGCALLVPAHGLFGAVTAVACGGTVRVLYLALGTRRTLSIG
jgi:O-antigen/teichoic acid export membrane protein